VLHCFFFHLFLSREKAEASIAVSIVKTRSHTWYGRAVKSVSRSSILSWQKGGREKQLLSAVAPLEKWRSKHVHQRPPEQLPFSPDNHENPLDVLGSRIEVLVGQ
jgi:hypothetical protein